MCNAVKKTKDSVPSHSTQDSLRILREFWADIWNRRQISWDDIWDDLVAHTPPRPAPDSWPSLTPEQLRSATKCSRGSAPGLDGWRAEELSLFSDEMWQVMSGFYDHCEGVFAKCISRKGNHLKLTSAC